VAVSVTVCGDVTADTLAAKVAFDAPDGTETESGTNTALLLLARLTTIPPLGAGALNFTVHASEPAPVIDAVVQPSPDSEGDPLPCSLTVPPALPAASTLSWPVESVAEPGS
jgi:hypothetical protein